MIDSVETRILSDDELNEVSGGNFLGGLAAALRYSVPTSTSVQSPLLSGKAEHYFAVAFHFVNWP
jgi:bacteriocin-like protein